jgi:aerobic-type carbon monoxide dehydrogenase small subunit (CoxS/CutS family)
MRAGFEQLADRDFLFAFEPDGPLHRTYHVRIGRRARRRRTTAQSLAEESKNICELPSQFHKEGIYSNLPRHSMGAAIAIRVTVNGVRHERDVEPRLLLSDFIRQDLALTGTHVGCEHGVCGACTVLLDGEPVRACIMLAVQADGHDLQTVEALAGPAGELNPLQSAFHAEHGLQCGFCTPGFLMTLTAFLRDNPAPTDSEIRDALSANLCRCTGYHHIFEAAKRASRTTVP